MHRFSGHAEPESPIKVQTERGPAERTAAPGGLCFSFPCGSCSLQALKRTPDLRLDDGALVGRGLMGGGGVKKSECRK